MCCAPFVLDSSLSTVVFLVSEPSELQDYIRSNPHITLLSLVSRCLIDHLVLAVDSWFTGISLLVVVLTALGRRSGVAFIRRDSIRKPRLRRWRIQRNLLRPLSLPATAHVSVIGAGRAIKRCHSRNRSGISRSNSWNRYFVDDEFYFYDIVRWFLGIFSRHLRCSIVCDIVVIILVFSLPGFKFFCCHCNTTIPMLCYAGRGTKKETVVRSYFLGIGILVYMLHKNGNRQLFEKTYCPRIHSKDWRSRSSCCAAFEA